MKGDGTPHRCHVPPETTYHNERESFVIARIAPLASRHCAHQMPSPKLFECVKTALVKPLKLRSSDNKGRQKH